MADRRPHALDDDSFPVELFRSGSSDRRAADPAGGDEPAEADADLLLPGADELFPHTTTAADDNVDNAFDPPVAAAGALPVAATPGHGSVTMVPPAAKQDDELLPLVTQPAATAAPSASAEQPISPEPAATPAEHAIVPAPVLTRVQPPIAPAPAATQAKPPVAPVPTATRTEPPTAPAPDRTTPSPREEVRSEAEQPFVWPKPFPLPRPIPALSFTPPEAHVPAALPSELKAGSPPPDPTPRAIEAPPPAPPVPMRAPDRPAAARPSASDILRAIDALPSIELARPAAPAAAPPLAASVSRAPIAPRLSNARAEGKPVRDDQAREYEADAPAISAPTPTPSPLASPTPSPTLTPAAPARLAHFEPDQIVPAPIAHVEADRIVPASPVFEVPARAAAPPFELTAWKESTSAAALDLSAPPADSANDPDRGASEPRSDATGQRRLLDLPVLAVVDSAMPPDISPGVEPAPAAPPRANNPPGDASSMSSPNNTAADAPSAVTAPQIDAPSEPVQPGDQHSRPIEWLIPPLEPAAPHDPAAIADEAEPFLLEASALDTPSAQASQAAPAAPRSWATLFPSREFSAAAIPSASADSSATGGVETPAAVPMAPAPLTAPASAAIDPTREIAPAPRDTPAKPTTTAVSAPPAPIALTAPPTTTTVRESPASVSTGELPSPTVPRRTSWAPSGLIEPSPVPALPAPVLPPAIPPAASAAPHASLKPSVQLETEVPARPAARTVVPQPPIAPPRAVPDAAEVTFVAPTLPATATVTATPEPEPAAASAPSPAPAAVVEPPAVIRPLADTARRGEPVSPARTATTSREPPELRTPPDSAPPPAVSGLSLERLTNLDDLLRLAASCGASTLYVAPNARPSVRVGGELWVLEDIPILDAAELEALLFALQLAHNADPSAYAGGEWTFELPGAGRIRCMTFSDQRGAGSVFRIVPAWTGVADQLALSLEIQALTLEKDGLILVSGPRSSGKSAVIGSLLDLINRTRQAYIVTVQREVNATWEGERAFISQREARGGLDDMLAVGRAALRENPDVLVLQEVRSAALMSLSLDAAASGQLVFAGYTARTAPAGVAGILSLYPVEQRRHVQVSLAQSLRGIVAQTLVPRAGGGRAAARELLLNTPPIAAALSEGKTWQLPVAIEAGRNHGMVTMNEALLDLVQRGIVAAEDAYRQAPEQMVFLDALKRNGIDTSFVD
jgi:twitching motility protein PilT